MKKILPLLLLLCFATASHAQLLKPFAASPEALQPVTDFKNHASYQFDQKTFTAYKPIIPHLSTLQKINNSNALIELPLQEGIQQTFYMAEIDILSPEAAKLYPEIKTYDVQSLDGNISGRITVSPVGLRAMLLTANERINIEPVTRNNAVDHIVFSQNDQDALKPALCGVKDGDANNNAHSKTTLLFGDCILRTYKLAVAVSGEYYTQAGSGLATATAIAANVANVSLIYERELAIKFTLVTPVVFTNAATDPYPTASFPTIVILDTNNTVLNSVVGSANYDVGIVLSTAWSGGLAYLGQICNTNFKGGSAAGDGTNLTGAQLEIFIEHELGHQFNATHTMSAGTGSLCIDNLNQPTAYEIGGGSTIMAYAGAVCTGMFYQNNTDNYFHYNSLTRIFTHVQSKPTCGVTSVLTNNPPLLTVPATSYTIPHSTPFEFIVTGTDVNTSNTLKYNFEQYNAASTPMTAPPPTTATSGPMFRSYPPSNSNRRLFPPLANVLNNTANTWEVLPSVTRTLNFKAIVRDQATNGGCLAQEDIAVNVNSGAGPFAITSNNTSNSYTFGGTPITLTWNVASTSGAPVNSANVDVLFSADNGQTFPYTLLSNTPNDGTENIPVPSLNTFGGRFKVKSSNNIFLDINNAPQAISSSCLAAGSTFSPDATVNATVGSPALNLNLSPNYGTALTISGSIALTDPQSDLSVVNISGSNCITFSNPSNYDLYSFQVNASGSYTFTLPGSTPFGTMISLYENAFDPANGCTGFVTSNGVYNGSSISIGSSITATLNPGQNYVIRVGSFNSTSSPTFPASFPSAYSVTVTPPAGGGIFTTTPNPGASYTYKFVIVNNITGNIVAFSTNGDMTNAVNFPPGSYTVQGLSHSTSVSTATLNTYIGTSFNAFKSALLSNTICGNLSANSKLVIIGVVTALDYIKLAGQSMKDMIKLHWEVGGAVNMDRYIVERSNTLNEFSAIGNVIAENKTNYTFIDNEPINGNNFYIIKAIDKNNVIQYSNVIMISFGKTQSDVVSIFPNPSKTSVTIATGNNSIYECTVTDISGKIIQTFTITNGNYTLNVKDYAKGMYLLHGNSNDKNFVSKLVVE